MANLEFKYHYGKESEQYSFFRIPKVLYTDKAFKDLSSDAKVLYGILLDRMGLSIKNGWLDDQNRVFIIFTIEEIMETLNVSNKTAGKILDELDSNKGIGLIEKKRLGLGKPSLIYVKNFIINSSFEELKLKNLKKSGYENNDKHSPDTLQEMKNLHFTECNNDNSKDVENTFHKMNNLHGNNTNINNTDFSNTDINHSFSSGNGKSVKPIMENEKLNDEEEIIILKLKSNIQYSELIKEHVDMKFTLDSMIDIMKNVIISQQQQVISGNVVSYNIVKERFYSLHKANIVSILNHLLSTEKKIINLNKYLLTLLFNAPAKNFEINRNISSSNDYNSDSYYSNDEEILKTFFMNQ